MIVIFRLGHRQARDKRITTHVGLVGRAFGANCMLVDTKDEKLEKVLGSVIHRFGGDFSVKTGKKLRTILNNWSGKIIHLTMYGEHIDKALPKIPKDEDCEIWQKYEPKKLRYVDKILTRSSQKYSLWDKVEMLLKHQSYKFVKSKGDLLVLCRDLWPTLTTGEHKTIINAHHLFLREFQASQREKQREKEK